MKWNLEHDHIYVGTSFRTASQPLQNYRGSKHVYACNLVNNIATVLHIYISTTVGHCVSCFPIIHWLRTVAAGGGRLLFSTKQSGDMWRQQPNDYFKMHRGGSWNNFLTVSSCITTQRFLPKLTSLGFDQSPKQGCDIPKEVFQMISVTEGRGFRRCFKGNNVCVCVVVWVRKWECVRERESTSEHSWALKHFRAHSTRY